MANFNLISGISGIAWNFTDTLSSTASSLSAIMQSSSASSSTGDGHNSTAPQQNPSASDSFFDSFTSWQFIWFLAGCSLTAATLLYTAYAHYRSKKAERTLSLNGEELDINDILNFDIAALGDNMGEIDRYLFISNDNSPELSKIEQKKNGNNDHKDNTPYTFQQLFDEMASYDDDLHDPIPDSPTGQLRSNSANSDHLISVTNNQSNKRNQQKPNDNDFVAFLDRPMGPSRNTLWKTRRNLGTLATAASAVVSAIPVILAKVL